MRNFARTLPEQRRHQDHYQTGRDELLSVVPTPHLDDAESDRLRSVRHAVDAMLDVLDERERGILRHRFGLDGLGDPKTLEQVGVPFWRVQGADSPDRSPCDEAFAGRVPHGAGQHS